METNILEKTNVLNTNNVCELSEIYSNFVKEIHELINNTVYDDGISIKYKYRITHDIIESLNPVILKQSGIRNIKRFKRYLKQSIHTKSIYSINKLLNLVHKRILELDYSPKIVCDKHEKIQKLRKDYLEYKKIADKLLLEYKEEKGNFYK